MNAPSAWNRDRAAEIIDARAQQPGSALPILHELQEAFGHVPRDAIPMLADALNVSRAEMHGVVSFYHDFRSAPPGRRVLKLCRAEACQAAGGSAMAEALLRRLGLAWGGTTPDGEITVEAAYCLGLCACAPSGMLDGTPVGRLTAARLDALLDGVGA